MFRCTLILTAYSAALGFFVADLPAAETVVLNEGNWQEYVPAGKEVDSIYGDHVLRSDRLVAVIAKATNTRNANLTVKRVGGSLIDFTRRDVPNDQLSCYYPHGGGYVFEGPVEWPPGLPSAPRSAKLAFSVKPLASEDSPALPELEIVVGYELADGDDFLTIHSLVSNQTEESSRINLFDRIRADGEFEFGRHQGSGLWWCQDEYWKQAYGVVSQGGVWQLQDVADPQKNADWIRFEPSDAQAALLDPGESLVVARRLFAAANTFDLLARAAALEKRPVTKATVTVSDPAGPVADALIKLVAGERVVASGKTDRLGKLAACVPPGEYRWLAESLGRSHTEPHSSAAGTLPLEINLQLPPLGQVAGRIIDETGNGTPCRLAFFGRGVADPNFGPDSAVHGVRNLWHTHDGNFQVDVLPGKYELLISRGPEYDAIVKEIDVAAGVTTSVKERLIRSVDTTGWLSAELHSHSSPSGDTASSQQGRVLNLLVEHLEFIPCTEHQRISNYEPHLQAFGASRRVLTCAGMELTGNPLSLNHQNAFPLIEHPHEQDGGAPTIHPDPEFQIERLALWDAGSDKVVQINHPNLAQMIGDRDLDGSPDQGWRKMFHFADLIEVHPPELIFADLEVGTGGWHGRGNAIINWMQLLNLGYRVPGVVNTDAHWNYYGNGWLRNYVRSATDDPAAAELEDVCHALERGQVVMTNGPFLEVQATSGDRTVGPGEDLPSAGKTPRLAIRVQCPNWLDVSRVQVFVNGLPDERLNFRRSSHPEMFAAGVVKFEQEITLPLERDAHVIVATAAEGRKLGRVYGAEQGEKMPIAVSNPIFIDLNGGGFEPNGDMLGSPLPVEENHVPTHGHKHPHQES